MRSAAVLLAMLVGGALPARAEPVRYALSPGTVQVTFRAYGLGMLPITGNFTRFGGTLVVDRANPGTCHLDLQAEAASLRMPQQSMTDDAIGPDVMDVAKYPKFELAGDCRGATLEGTLLLHGTRKPVSMAVTLNADSWDASALIRRADWGITARPVLAGPEVRISVVAGLPR